MLERSRLREIHPQIAVLGILAVSLICGAAFLSTRGVFRNDTSQLPIETSCWEFPIQKGDTIYRKLNPESPLYTNPNHYDYRITDPNVDPGKWRDTFWNQAYTLPIGGTFQVGPDGWAENPPPDPLDCLLQPTH
jgi:hypothetical protein